MNNYIVLNKRKNIKKISKKIIQLNLYKSFKNRRTTIWENEDMQISIDKYIIRILIYSKIDFDFYKNFFIQRNYKK